MSSAASVTTELWWSPSFLSNISSSRRHFVTMGSYCTVCFSRYRSVEIGAAAKRVFAIPELLEPILLFIDDNNWIYKMAAAKRLYVLQRVNTTFANTIQGSGKLKYRMGLDYKPRGHVPLPSDETLSIFLNFLTPALRIRYQIDDGVLHININATLNQPAIPYFQGTRRSLAQTTLKRRSWHKATITSIRIPTQINVLMQFQNSNDHGREVRYREY